MQNQVNKIQDQVGSSLRNEISKEEIKKNKNKKRNHQKKNQEYRRRQKSLKVFLSSSNPVSNLQKISIIIYFNKKYLKMICLDRV